MTTHFDLAIRVSQRTAELSLLDGHGVQLGFRQVDFASIPLSQQRGLFDLRNYVRNYVEPGRQAETVAEVGVCIAEQILGPELFAKLAATKAQRTLRIQLPAARAQDEFLTAALARVPWEIARPSADQPPLSERNLVVRMVHALAPDPVEPLELGTDESLRILFVFAEARGSRPLAARRERRELLRLFEAEIYPQRRVEAHTLTHGVTRARLRAQIRDHGGYHAVHWSGHGHLNLLELAKPGGGKDQLAGEELVELFHEAGGFIPRLFFLSACHSGDLSRVKNWSEFLALAQGQQSETKDVPSGADAAAATKSISLAERAGYTGTAHALIQGGVASVVAMRYAVGDDYARALAVEFYRALLAHAKPKSAAEALTLARRSLLAAETQESVSHHVCDHATPVLYGEEHAGLVLRPGRSPALESRQRRLHRLADLTHASHEHFVGRTWQLAELGADFLGASRGDEVKPVALITGIGGMGKTALCAEALALWEPRFEWLALYQARPNKLGLDAVLQDLHAKLYGELGRYHAHIQKHPADAIYRAAESDFKGEARFERLTCNLVRALRDEPILLVLDNFETNLKPSPDDTGGDTEPAWACQDPAWDHCLRLLAEELPGLPSRLLITSRRPLAALAGRACHVRLGPLSAGEAALYLRSHPGLRALAFGAAVDKALAVRLLDASRFHPLLMDRLARLASGGEALRPQLLQALDALEQSHDHGKLPALFAEALADAKQLEYLEDALAKSLDQLIQSASPDARRVLWMIALANEPVTFGLLAGTWSGETYEQQRLRSLKQPLERLPSLDPELRAQLQALPENVRAAVAALPPEPPHPNPTSSVRALVALGLANEEFDGPSDQNPELSCHELVRERIAAWMERRPLDRADLTENGIRLAYAERLKATFRDLQHIDMDTALEAGRRGLVYYIQAGDNLAVTGFGSTLVTSSRDPRLLASLIPHLELAAEAAPEGPARWRCLWVLADALAGGGRVEASLSLYERAADQARAAAEAGDASAGDAWSDLGAIFCNWAHALRNTGNLSEARLRQLESAETSKKAGSSPVSILGSELEVLRIDIMQGRASEARAEVEARLEQVRQWWAGQEDHATTGDRQTLARLMITALDIANDCSRAQDDWAGALRYTDELLELQRDLKRPATDIAVTRMNRSAELVRLGRFDEAREELELCLNVFRDDPARRSQILSTLANLFDKQDDVTQAIVQGRRALAADEQLDNPDYRAIGHDNLANYLHRARGLPGDGESAKHRLAAFVYRLVSQLGQGVQGSLQNYAVLFRRSQSQGETLSVPRVSELLADSAFHPLQVWLTQRQVDLGELQAVIDRLLTQAEQAAKEALPKEEP